MRYLLPRLLPEPFDAALDNLTLLRQASEEEGITRWAVRRAFRLGGEAGGASPPR
ncbi:MAG TPA: hypothetical protein VJU81_23290 [Methylomirabilota bacterium]|nr:hypothetical protein [Methylomirabilota bacterium]